MHWRATIYWNFIFKLIVMVSCVPLLSAYETRSFVCSTLCIGNSATPPLSLLLLLAHRIVYHNFSRVFALMVSRFCCCRCCCCCCYYCWCHCASHLIFWEFAIPKQKTQCGIGAMPICPNCLVFIRVGTCCRFQKLSFLSLIPRVHTLYTGHGELFVGHSGNWSHSTSGMRKCRFTDLESFEENDANTTEKLWFVRFPHERAVVGHLLTIINQKVYSFVTGALNKTAKKRWFLWRFLWFRVVSTVINKSVR
jgi:hypothetical protein